MDADKIEELKGFVEHCKQNPSVLHTPSLAFFKNFLQSLGAQIPPPSGKSGRDGEEHQDEKHFESKNTYVSSDDISNEDIVKSDVELDNSDVVEPDNDPPVKVGFWKKVDEKLYLVMCLLLFVYSGIADGGSFH